MTGFGKAEVKLENKSIIAEIRSLNSKQLDLAVKMPSIYRSVEAEVRSLLAKQLVRGKVDLFVTVESREVQAAAQVDKEQFRAYLSQVTEACALAGVEPSYDQIVAAVLRMPNVVNANDVQAPSEEELQAVVQAVSEAAAHLDEFRAQEGEVLIADLLRRVDKIWAYREQITPYEESRTSAVRERILEGIAKLGVEVDNNRLEQEMIFYIEKLDITEERVRLHNHCKYFREVAAQEPQAGRKLGFIAQEMGREINTTGSKANDHEIQKLVVQMKDELEKIKEQVLNVL
ncbi:MAG: YicC family protein [Alistipes sp.]|nr:YicC family protein [Alistipes sp.]